MTSKASEEKMSNMGGNQSNTWDCPLHGTKGCNICYPNGIPANSNSATIAANLFPRNIASPSSASPPISGSTGKKTAIVSSAHNEARKRKLPAPTNVNIPTVSNNTPRRDLQNMSPSKVTKLDVVEKTKTDLVDDPTAQEMFKSLGVSQSFFQSGKVLAWALSPDDEAFIDIHDYVQRSQDHYFGIKILTILRIISKADDFQEFDDDPVHKGKVRMMLWHGTKKHAVAPILEGGLLIPQSNGQMFGRGVYFADRASKSAQYCYGGSGAVMNAGSKGYLFLCDVLLGNTYEASNPNHSLLAPPQGYESVKGIGWKIPDRGWDKEVGGCTWPLGPTIQRKSLSKSKNNPILQFNEYVVYRLDQVHPKYLVKVEFARQKFFEDVC